MLGSHWQGHNSSSTTSTYMVTMVPSPSYKDGAKPRSTSRLSEKIYLWDRPNWAGPPPPLVQLLHAIYVTFPATQCSTAHRNLSQMEYYSLPCLAWRYDVLRQKQQIFLFCFIIVGLRFTRLLRITKLSDGLNWPNGN